MFHLRPAGHFRALAVAVCFLAGLCLRSAPGLAQIADAYAVRNVSVDVSAANAGIARDQALVEGQRQAFQILLQRMTNPADAARLPHLSDHEIVDLVVDVGVDQERRSAVRYLATLSVRFKADAVRRLLRANNIAYAEWRGRPVVVLPVWRGEAGPVLSEADNPWREAWRSGAAQGVVPLIAPNADQTEGVVNGPSAVQGGADLLSAVGARFQTRDVLLAQASAQPGENGSIRVDVSLGGVGPIPGSIEGSRSYSSTSGETLDMLLRRAVQDVAQSVNDNYKSGNLLLYGQSGTLSAIVPLDGSLADWLSVRDKLTRSTVIRGYDIVGMTRRQASLSIRYVGDQQQLQSILAQNGLSLNNVGDHWELTDTPTRPAIRAR